VGAEFSRPSALEARNQLVLNLARPDVRAYVLSFLDKLLTENDIAFLKWDYNRNWSEPGWISFPRRNRSAYMSSSRGTSMRSWPSCGTGTRMWRSNPAQAAADEWTWEFCATPTRFGPRITPDPFDRLTQQNGFTYAYTPQIMMAWVTDSPHWLNRRSTSLSYRMLSSMQGSLGIGANIANWTPDENALAKRLIAAYHQVQPTIVQESFTG